MKVVYPPLAAGYCQQNVVALNLDDTDGVASMASKTIYVEAPTGFVYRIIDMYLKVGAPAGASSGTHKFEVLPVGGRNHLVGVSVFGSELQYDLGYWITADSAQQPPAGQDQHSPIRGLLVRETSKKVSIEYQNATDVIQNNKRYIRVFAEQMFL